MKFKNKRLQLTTLRLINIYHSVKVVTVRIKAGNDDQWCIDMLSKLKRNKFYKTKRFKKQLRNSCKNDRMAAQFKFYDNKIKFRV